MRARAFAWLFLVTVATVGAATGCAEEEGVTPERCLDTENPLPLYDVNAAGEANAPEVQAAIQSQIERGCLTPIGTAKSGTLPPPGSGGSP